MPRRQIGTIAVDSGQIFITDPGYLERWRHGDYPAEDGNSYDRVTRFMLEHVHGEVEDGVVVSSFGGDGVYPVFVVEDEAGWTVKLEILFDEPDD